MKIYTALNRCFGVLAGIFIIVIGIMMIAYSGNRLKTPADYKFGGDYYSRQYEVTKTVSENLNSINKEIIDIVHFAGYLCVCFGVVVICRFDQPTIIGPAVNVRPAPMPQTGSDNKAISNDCKGGAAAAEKVSSENDSSEAAGSYKELPANYNTSDW